MSEESFKYLLKLFALLSIEEKKTSSKNIFVQKFLQKKLSKQKAEIYYQIFLKELAKVDHSKSLENALKAPSYSELFNNIKHKTDNKVKIVLIVNLFEFMSYENSIYDKELPLLKEIALLIDLPEITYVKINFFLLLDDRPSNYVDALFVIGNRNINHGSQRKLDFDDISGEAYFYYFPFEDLFLFKNFTISNVVLNNQKVEEKEIYFFSRGSSLKLPNGKQLFYSDLNFLLSSEQTIQKIHFKVDSVSFSFGKEKMIEMNNVSFHENHGKFIGILGASGAGKTTLLNIMSGIQKPKSGTISINGTDINKNPEIANGIFGYIGQDDILIENLTVFENLYFNAKLSFGNKKEEEINEIVFKTLEALDLKRIGEVQVGNVLNKKISGGQRKRLMIALELMREPHILLVDEPTSGLSSQDSKNVIRLLKELTVRGKLIFTVIHQPSLDIYHSFDRIFVLDNGGVPVFYGNPTECLSYFNKAKSDLLEKPINEFDKFIPEQILETIESKVLDEFGGETSERKFKPQDWNNLYKSTVLLPKVEKYDTFPKSNLILPSKLEQWFIFCQRDLLSKWNNKTYLFINFLEAPLLAFALAFVLKHKNNINNTQYVFGYNDNIPAFILISIIVALFIGLSTSVQEIIKDRKVRKRELFLTLSRNSYLFSKIAVLFLFSAIQMLSFIIVSHTILEIKDVMLEYWIILFSTACAANMLGLCVSDSFKSAISAYIIIPILLIPQLVLSGALFDFDKLNQNISAYGKTPLIADIMISRWSYEAIAVWQEKENKYNQYFYEIDKEISRINYLKNYWLPELHKLESEHANSEKIDAEIAHFKTTFGAECENCNEAEAIKQFLFERKKLYTTVKDKVIESFKHKNINLTAFREQYFNEKLHLLVRHLDAEHRILKLDNHFTQNFDAIYLEPSLEKATSWRAPMFVSYKNLFGYKIHTFVFNLIVIWLFIFFFYLILYSKLFSLILNFIEHIKIKLQ